MDADIDFGHFEDVNICSDDSLSFAIDDGKVEDTDKFCYNFPDDLILGSLLSFLFVFRFLS